MDILRAETRMDYMKCAAAIGLPVVMQNMVSSMVNTLDVFMLGQLGEVAITASAMGNQWFCCIWCLQTGLPPRAPCSSLNSGENGTSYIFIIIWESCSSVQLRSHLSLWRFQ